MNNYYFNNGTFKTITAIPGWAEDYNSGLLTSSSTPKAYLSSAWAFRAVTLRADAIAGAPLKLYDSQDEEIERHPLLDLLAYVNAEWNRADLWRYTEAGSLVHGAGYWQKVRAGNRGQPRELYYVNPSTMTPEFDATGIVGFSQQTTTGKVTYDRQDIVYFRGSYDPASDLTGIPALQLAVQAAMAEANADAYLAAYFKNGAVPALLLTTEQQIDQGIITQIRDWWRKTFQGVGNQHKVGITGSGLKPVQIGTNPKDLALSEVRIELHRSISTALGVPELLISPTNAADLTPVKMAERVFYSTTILPRWEWYAEILNAELVPEYPDLVNSGAYLAFDWSEISALQEDTNDKAARLVSLVQAGIIKPEVAAEELGFDEDDVPMAPEPAEPAQPKTDPATMDEPPDAEDMPMMDAQADAEKKWKRKAEHALKRGGSASVDFVTDDIPPGRMDAIRAGLAQAKTLGEVADAFDTADPLTLLALELRRANDLLAA